MRLTDVLRPEHVIAPLGADTFRGAVMELVQRLVDTGALEHPDRLERLTSEDRVRDVVHIGDRVLLPHLRTDAVDDLTVALGVSEKPLRAAPGVPEASEQVVVLVLPSTGPEAIEKAWPYLAHKDRFIRFAARSSESASVRT